MAREDGYTYNPSGNTQLLGSEHPPILYIIDRINWFQKLNFCLTTRVPILKYTGIHLPPVACKQREVSQYRGAKGLVLFPLLPPTYREQKAFPCTTESLGRPVWLVSYQTNATLRVDVIETIFFLTRRIDVT